MKRFGILLGALALLALPPAFAARPGAPATPKAAGNTSAAAPAEPSEAELRAQYEAIKARLHPQTGDIRLPSANAVLHLGQDYYFLPADEARIVLTEAWGNPPEAASDVLGIVFPAGRQFYEPDVWGAVITYEATGYVSDDDADSADYAELMQQMQASEPEVNQQRRAAGYPEQHLIGWAQQPAYDRNTHSVVWARNIRLGDTAENTLNYDVRLLGRNGVLSLNMVTVMSQLGETRQAAQRFASHAEFTQGFRYADHQSGDRTAEYGVAGLVAAGLGAAAVKKAGFLILILAFLKKAGIFIIAGIAFLWGAIRRFFTGRKDDESYYYEAPPPADPTAAGPAVAPAPTDAAAPGEGQPPERSG